MNKIVLITGCSSGIGESLAISFQNYGCKVYATSRNVDAMSGLREKGITTMFLDVTVQQSIQDVVQTIIEEEGRIDILVNNAGMILYAPAVETPEQDMLNLWNINFFGLVNTTIAVSKHMIKQRNGLIVNMGSIVGLRSAPFASIYSASKAAVHSYSDTLRIELAPFNIKVLTAMPGPLKSNLVDRAVPLMEKYISDHQDSPYKLLFQDLRNRATHAKSSQVSIQLFSNQLLKNIFSRNIPAIFRYGPGSFLFLIFSIIPCRIVDYLLSKKFGLLKFSQTLKLQQQQQPTK
eukprot:gene3816-4748_t